MLVLAPSHSVISLASQLRSFCLREMHRKLSVAVAILSSLLSRCHCAVLSLPEPECHPILEPQLLVVSAGREWIRSRISEVTLRNGYRICPSDYPRGFSIRCEPASTVRKVKFFVNGVYVKTEITEPYYIAGNYASGMVKAWKTHFRNVIVICQYGRNTQISRRINILC